jgi:hypothetical protein
MKEGRRKRGDVCGWFNEEEKTNDWSNEDKGRNGPER